MYYGVATAIALGLASLSGGNACAMTGGPAATECRVIGGEKLPAETGGEAICTAVRDALVAAKVRTPVKVDVLVTSDSGLTARIEAGGKRLPDEEVAVMDRKLNRQSIEMLARRIAEVAGQAG